MTRSRHNLSLLSSFIAATLIIAWLTVPSVAQAQVAGLSQPLSILDILRGDRRGTGCTFNSDCGGGLVCFEAQCTDPETAAAYQYRRRQAAAEEARRNQDGPTHSHDPLPDDGGADAACGQDRRCRIARLKARNRQRRRYNIARQQDYVDREIERISSRPQDQPQRQSNPWSLAFQRHPFGLGIVGGRTFASHFRAEISYVYRSDFLDYVPEDSSAPTLNDIHDATFGTAHFTYLPSRAWFSPLLSVGFAMGRGNYGGFDGQGPQVRYHVATAALGAEAHFDLGLVVRVAYRHGRVLYNQVRYGPGSYDSDTQQGLREYMNDQGLSGIDFSIGWAF